MASCTCEGKASGRLADLATVVITVTPFPKIISPEVGRMILEMHLMRVKEQIEKMKRSIFYVSYYTGDKETTSLQMAV